jgi:hypothetical protein
MYPGEREGECRFIVEHMPLKVASILYALVSYLSGRL